MPYGAKHLNILRYPSVKMGERARTMAFAMAVGILLIVALAACTPTVQDTGTPEPARTVVREREPAEEPPAPTARLAEDVAALIAKGRQAEGEYYYCFYGQAST